MEPRKRGRPSTVTESVKKLRKIEAERKRRTQLINIGDQRSRWEELRIKLGHISHESFARYLLDRTGGVKKPEMHQDSRPAISVEKSVHDAEHAESREQPQRPEKSQVGREVEIVGLVSIVYHDCLKQLAEYLLLPVKKCPTKDPVTSAECGSAGPFRTQISSQGSALIMQWKCPNNHCVWNWNSQVTEKNGLQAGNGSRQPLERQESHFADNCSQTSPCKPIPPPSDADLGKRHPCEIVVEVNDCDEPPPATQDQDHSTAVSDTRTRCTEEEAEGISSSEEEFLDDSNDEDYVPPLPAGTGGANKSKIHGNSLPAVGVEKTVHDAVHTESEERSPTLISNNSFSGETSVLELDDDDDVEGEESSDHENRSEKPSEEPTVPRKPKKTFECPTCGRVCSSSCSLKQHLVIHSGLRPFRCFVCGQGFTQSGNLKTHMKVHKGESAWSFIQGRKPPGKSPVRVDVCKDCGMVFPEKHQLEEHGKTHRLHRCTVCGKTLKSEKSLKVHERVHSEDSAVRCRVCGKRFPTEFCLKKHTFVHRAKKKFKCDQCGRAFITSTMLKYHFQSHTGERRHLCSICGKRFWNSHGLKIHLHVHSGEKRYVCEQCGKGFIYGSGFRSHLKTHNKKPKERTKPLGRPKRAAVTANN